MVSYFLLFFASASQALFSRRFDIFKAILAFVILILFIGFRYETGGDWTNYFEAVLYAYQIPFSEFLSSQNYEPLYALLNWIGANIFGGLFLVNSVCASIFSYSLIKFCRRQPDPWLALTLAIPYLVIVVAMGYTRQSVAIAFLMLALLSIQLGKNLEYILFIFIASLFHRPVLVMMALLVFNSQFILVNISSKAVQLVKAVLLAFAGYGFYSAYSDELYSIVKGYEGDYLGYSPQGAFLRIGLTVIFSVIFLTNRKKFSLSCQDDEIWAALCKVALLPAIGLALGILPTLLDRFALYLLPIQLYVGSRIPYARIFGISSRDCRIFLVSLSFFYLFLWLNYANNSFAWLPYNNILF